jgi:HAD superfamily hydrolase (TIGR01509 family)
MDGVLIDSHPVHRHAWRKFLASRGRTVDDEQLEYILEGRRREEILRHFLGNLPENTLAEYGREKDSLFQENFHNVQLTPGVAGFLAALEATNIKIGVATSASFYRTWKTLEVLGLTTTFATVVTSDDVLSGKPDPTVYRIASQRMHVAADKLLVLEDAPCGVQAAKSAGMRCIGVSSNGRARALSEAGADHVISDFRGLSLERVFRLWNAINRNGRRSMT